MKLIIKQHTGKGSKALLPIHRRNGSYTIDVKDDNSKTPKIMIRTDVLNDLLKEQGYICAYCMKKIELCNATIEHIIGQNYIDESKVAVGKIEDTNYENMLAVCKGNSCKEYHCDKSRAKYQAKRPVLVISPLNNQQMQHIKFSKNGAVYYKEPEDIIDKTIETELDKECRYDINSILNLNCERLMHERKKIISAIQTLLIKSKFNKHLASNELRKWLLNSGGYEEYCQVAICKLSRYV